MKHFIKATAIGLIPIAGIFLLAATGTIFLAIFIVVLVGLAFATGEAIIGVADDSEEDESLWP